MAQQVTNPGDCDNTGRRGSGSVGYLPWLVALAGAIAVFQLTGNALLAAAIPYVEAGWRPFRCGLWLLRSDPVPARGRACFWFYLAMAGWSAAAAAFTVLVVLLGMEWLAGKAAPANEISVSLLTVFGGVVLSAAIGLVAVISALRGGVRVWAHPTVLRQCGGDFRRLGESGPLDDPRRVYLDYGFNRAACVVATSLFPFAAVGVGLLLWRATVQHDGLPVLEVLLLTFGPLLAVIPVYAILSSRIVARTPADCWGPQNCHNR